MIARLIHNNEFKMLLSYMCYYQVNTPFGIFQDSFVTQGVMGMKNNNLIMYFVS